MRRCRRAGVPGEVLPVFERHVVVQEIRHDGHSVAQAYERRDINRAEEFACLLDEKSRPSCLRDASERLVLGRRGAL